MKRFLHVSAGVCLFLLAIAAVSVGETNGPQIFTVQGVLEDDDGDAVKDSMYTVSAGLWNQIIGGSSLSTPELHVVATKNGVFTVELNESGHFMENCAPCEAWLEIQVMKPGGFETLSPRTPLSAVPHALTSAGVYSEKTSGSAVLHVTDDGPTMHLRSYDGLGFDHHHIDMTVNDSSAVLEFGHSNDIEWPELKASDAKKHLEITARMPDKSQEALVTVDTASASVVLKSDPDTDDIPDAEAGSQVTESVSRTWSSHKTNTELAEASMTTSDSGSALDLTWDDGSGKGGIQGKAIRKNISVNLFKSDKKHAARMAVDSGSSEIVLEADQDGDGIPEQSVQHRISDRALLGLKNYDPLLAYTPGDDIILQTDDSSSSIELSRQSSSDEAKIRVGNEASSMKLKHYTPGQPYYGNFVVEASDSGAALDVTNLNDGGESGMKVKSIRKNITINLRTHQTKGPIAHFGVDSAGALTYVEADPDDDGDQSGVRCDAIETRSTLKTYFEAGSSRSHVMDSVDDGSAHTSVLAESSTGGTTMQCNAGYHRADFYVHRTVPDPGSIAFQVAEAVTIQTAPDTARLDITEHQGNHADGWSLLQADGTCMMQGTSGGRSSIVRCSDASCSMVMVDETGGTSDTGIVIDAVTKRFGIGVSQPANPIDHSSGAHLTAGGVWTNASDAALKENFQPVNGSDLLERIDKLQITRWNYRNESDDITHIGPTAQDFKHLFGVGDNDRSISTVDPSGIALAAIKELHRENDELREQNLELTKRLDELSRKLDGVLSRP